MCVLSRFVWKRVVVASSFKAGEMFFAPAPQYLDHVYTRGRCVCFCCCCCLGCGEEGERAVFPRTERGEEAARRKKAKAERVKKSKKKRTIKLRCFCLCPSLAPSLLIMSKEVLSSAFFSERCFFAFFWTARTKGVLIKRTRNVTFITCF